MNMSAPGVGKNAAQTLPKSVPTGKEIAELTEKRLSVRCSDIASLRRFRPNLGYQCYFLGS